MVAKYAQNLQILIMLCNAGAVGVSSTLNV